MREYLRNNLNGITDQVIEHVITVMRGWINYHGISDRRASAFMHIVRRMLHWWVNRRGGKRGMNWVTFNILLVCSNLDWLRLSIDSKLNQKNQTKINNRSSRVEVYMIPTDEEWMIANHSLQLLK